MVLMAMVGPVMGCVGPTPAPTQEKYPNHVTDFSFEPTAPVVGETVTFTDKTTWQWDKNAQMSWEWDFGDGSSISTEQNPTHSYDAVGTYVVELITTNKNPGKGVPSESSTKSCEQQIVVTYPLYGDGEDDPSANLNNKDEGAGWMIIDDGRYGKLYTDYLVETFYVEAFGMEENTDYSLIYYPDPWPCTITVLGSAVSNDEGYVTITGVFDLDISNNENEGGYKLWLVPSSDIGGCGDQASFNAWNPANYLFETELFPIVDNEPALIVPADEFVPDEASHTPATYGADLGEKVYLSKKSFDGSVWNAVDFKECGVMEVGESGYEVMASRLDPSRWYTLIYYADPYTSPKEVLVIGSGESDKWGRMRFSGVLNFAELIDPNDENLDPDTTTYKDGLTGVKFWLVPEDAVSGNGILDWNANEGFLFEAELYEYCQFGPKPEIDFTYDQDSEVPLKIRFTDTSSNVPVEAVYEWSFGDGADSSEQNPDHTYGAADDYTVTLTVKLDGDVIGSTSKTVTVLATSPEPVVGFLWKLDIDTPLTVKFTDASEHIPTGITYAWVFGDGASSSEQNPVHTYSEATDYIVTLTIKQGDVEIGTDTQTVTVTASPPKPIPPNDGFDFYGTNNDKCPYIKRALIGLKGITGGDEVNVPFEWHNKYPNRIDFVVQASPFMSLNDVQAAYISKGEVVNIALWGVCNAASIVIKNPDEGTPVHIQVKQWHIFNPDDYDTAGNVWNHRPVKLILKSNHEPTGYYSYWIGEKMDNTYINSDDYDIVMDYVFTFDGAYGSPITVNGKPYTPPSES